jgi:hypothetical protein
MAALLSIVGVAVAAWLPHWPETIYRFFNRLFQLEGWSAIVLANNLTGFIFFLYWFGIVDILKVYVVPFEENYLDLWLSKPVRRGSYMLARTLPTFAVITAAGAIAGVVHGIGMTAFGLELDPAAYAGTIAAVLGVVLFMLAMANLALLFLRDSFAALVVAFVVFMASFVPSIVYMYRPDAFAGSAFLRDVLIFPTSLLWYPETAAAYGLPIGIAFAAAALGLLLLAGAILTRRDIA